MANEQSEQDPSGPEGAKAATRPGFMAYARKFVSLPAAMITLTTIAMFSIYGTVWYEGQESMDFFAELPFSIVCIIFMAQLFVAVLTRIPWKITHTGWIITHTGLIIICLGHMTTCQKGYTGQVGLAEGTSTGYVSLESYYLTVDLPEQKQRVKIKLPLKLLEQYPDDDIALGTASLPNGDTLTVVRFLPSFDVRPRIEPVWDETVPLRPTYQLELNSGAGDPPIQTWVFADEGRNFRHMRGAPGTNGLTALHVRHATQDELQARFAAGELVFQPSGLRVPIAEALESVVQLEGGITVEARRRFAAAVPNRGGVMERPPGSQGAANPAVEVVFSIDGQAFSVAVVEARAPEPLRPETPDGIDLGEFAVSYEVPEAFLATGGLRQSSIALLSSDDAPESLLVAVTDDNGVTKLGPYVPGATIPLQWLAQGDAVLTASLNDYLPRARVVEEVFCPSYRTSRIGLKVRLSGDGPQDVEQWVIDKGVISDQPVPTTINRPSGPLNISYGQERRPLGFDIRLEDFVLETHEGTQNPRSFESFVRIVPEHRSYKLLMPHIVPPANGGTSGSETITLALAGSEGLEAEDVLRIGTPQAYYYALVKSIVTDSSGQARVEVENIGRPVPLSEGDQVPAGVSAQELYHIYMNHTLTHNGFKFFQSSYDPNTLKYSIFSVANDPGGLVVYLGYILTVLGLVFIVYVKPILARRISARRAAAGLARREAMAREGSNDAGDDGIEPAAATT